MNFKQSCFHLPYVHSISFPFIFYYCYLKQTILVPWILKLQDFGYINYTSSTFKWNKYACKKGISFMEGISFIASLPQKRSKSKEFIPNVQILSVLIWLYFKMGLADRPYCPHPHHIHTHTHTQCLEQKKLLFIKSCVFRIIHYMDLWTWCFPYRHTKPILWILR